MGIQNYTLKSTGLKRLEVVSPEKFASPLSLKLRRFFDPLLRKVILASTGRKIILEQYPSLEKNESYVFCSTHYFTEDIQVGLGILDRNAWGLIGTTDQLEHNFAMYGGWLHGIVYVDRKKNESRKDSVKKMEYLLNHGSSVWVCPEGGWNNSENLLVQQLFASPYILYESTGKKSVPMAIYNDEDTGNIYVRVGDPIDFSGLTKEEALTLLRNEMAKLMLELMLSHQPNPVSRADLIGDQHLRFRESRRKEYMRTPWTRDVWDEELTVYHGRSTPEQIVRDLEFKKYMKDYWQSPPSQDVFDKADERHFREFEKITVNPKVLKKNRTM